MGMEEKDPTIYNLSQPKKKKKKKEERQEAMNILTNIFNSHISKPSIWMHETQHSQLPSALSAP